MGKRDPIPVGSLPWCPMIVHAAVIDIPKDEWVDVSFRNTVDGVQYEFSASLYCCEEYTDCDSMSIVEVTP